MHPLKGPMPGQDSLVLDSILSAHRIKALLHGHDEGTISIFLNPRGAQILFGLIVGLRVAIDTIFIDT